MLCDSCRRKCSPWSDEVAKEWNGCTLMLDNGYIKTEQDVKDLYDNISVDSLATAWIRFDNGRCVNNQLLVKNVTSCNYYEEKYDL